MLNLNLGCGTKKKSGYLNVDNFGEVDFRWDLNKFPYPWADNTVDKIEMFHVLEHIPNWWQAFTECARILKPGGTLQINVPDESSRTALTYRDHYHVFYINSFHGIQGNTSGTNTWAKEQQGNVPLVLESYYQVPYPEYYWMTRFPFKRLLKFCADHLRNFIHEQQFHFRKINL